VATSLLNETQPAVAIDDAGRFTVVWTLKTASGVKEVWGQHFNADGSGRSGEFLVASPAYDPDVAVDPTGSGMGDFVVSMSRDYDGSPDKDVIVAMYTDGGTTHFDFFGLFANGDGVENKSSIARDDDGNFSVAYQDASLASPSNTNIRLARFDNAGNQLQDVQLAGASYAESNPSVGMGNDGWSYVAWQQQNTTSTGGWNIRARYVSSTGIKGSTIQIASTSATETLPAIGVQPGSSYYVVAYQSQSGSTTSVKVSERIWNGTDLGTVSLGSSRFKPSVGVGDTLGYFVAYEKTGDATDPGKGIFSRLAISLTPPRALPLASRGARIPLAACPNVRPALS
jgi:hypothetical protein